MTMIFWGKNKTQNTKNIYIYIKHEHQKEDPIEPSLFFGEVSTQGATTNSHLICPFGFYLVNENVVC